LERERNDPVIERDTRSSLPVKSLTRRGFVQGAAAMGLAGSALGRQTRSLDVVFAAQGTPDTGEEIPRGGAFTAGHQTSILSMDPAATGEPQVRTIRNCVTEALFDLDPDANLIPRLAESWEQTDEKTYVLKLRQGVKFHDGNPFDAEVVKFNLERMLNPETQNVWASEIAQLESVDVIDTYTVQLKTKALLAAFLIPLYDMNGMQLSPAAVEEWGADIGFHPVGTGPFRFVEFIKDQHVVLERNPDYWQPGKPYLDQLTFNAIPVDSTRLTDLRSGGIQLAEYLPFQDIARLRDSQEIIVSERPGFRVDYLNFNVTRSPGSSKEFRQAWNWLIDRDAFMQGSYFGTGAPAWDLFLPGTRFYDPEYRPTQRDVGKAKELLAASGVQLPIDLTMYATQDPVVQRDAQITQANVAEAGINLAIEVVDQARYNEIHQPRPDGSAGDFDVQLSWWGFRPDPDQYLGVILKTNGSWNWGKYSNPEFDQLLVEEQGELDDAKRIAVFRQIAELLTEDAPVIPYHFGANVKGLTPNVEGFVHRADGLVRYVDMGLRQ
jgi:peptide/nickel transport system substrate-binding protein